jgi:hypothetical protein
VKHILLALFACAALALSGCQSTSGNGADTAGNEAVNTVCPMMPSHEIDPEVTREFMGMKVAFCCAKCTGGWDDLSDAEKKAKLEEIGVSMN